MTAESPLADGRRVRGSATRTNAINAAAELFTTQGYSATSISSIAAAAGIHGPSLYHAFGSKEGILAAVVEHASNEFFDQLDWLNGPVTLAEAISRLKTLFDERPLFLHMLLILALERGNADPELLQTAADVRSRGRALIREVIARELPNASAEKTEQILDDLSRLLMVFLDGALIARQIDADDAALDRLFRVFSQAMQLLVAEHATTP
jgi:AcrR family transcriptional regulator